MTSLSTFVADQGWSRSKKWPFRTVTFNSTDFRGAESFGVQVITPKELLTAIGDYR